MRIGSRARNQMTILLVFMIVLLYCINLAMRYENSDGE